MIYKKPFWLLGPLDPPVFPPSFYCGRFNRHPPLSPPSLTATDLEYLFSEDCLSSTRHVASNQSADVSAHSKAAAPKRTGRALRNSQFVIRNGQGFFSGIHFGLDDWGERTRLACSFQRPRWKHRRGRCSTRASNTTAGAAVLPSYAETDWSRRHSREVLSADFADDADGEEKICAICVICGCPCRVALSAIRNS